MIRASGPVALVGALLIAACDFHGNDIVVEPEYDLAYSFENGLQDWEPAGTDLTDPVVDWSVERTADASSDGSHSVRLTLDNLNDQGKIWIQRAFDVAPDTTYDVTIAFDLGTSDQGDVNLWTVLAGATDSLPTRADQLTPRDNTGGAEGDGVTWTPREYTTTVTSGDDGKLWVHLGVWGTYEVQRTYYLDNVRVTFMRGTQAP